MIEVFHRVVVGREEDLSIVNRAVRSEIEGAISTMEGLWRWRWPDALDVLETWNVAVLTGPFGAWDSVELRRYEGLGSRYLPHLTERVRNLSVLGIPDPAPVGDDPQVLWESWKLVPHSGWWERCRRFGRELRDLGVRPERARTLRELNSELALRGKAIQHASDRSMLVALERDRVRSSA